MATTFTSQVRQSRRKFHVNLLIGISFVVSASILVWSFTTPFRQEGKALVSSNTSKGTSERLNGVDHDGQLRTSAEEFRDAAIALDKEFMRSVAKRNQSKRELPGIEQSRRSWHRHRESVKRKLDQLSTAKAGSLEADYRRELAQSLDDGPQ